MDLANPILVPTREAPNIGTVFANAKLMPTREAPKLARVLHGVNLGPQPQMTHVIKCKIHVDKVCVPE